MTQYNQIYNVKNTTTEPNLGFEQSLWQRHFTFRFGVDETSETGGISLRFNPIVIDIAYVHNLELERVGTVFGPRSNSILSTVCQVEPEFLRRQSEAGSDPRVVAGKGGGQGSSGYLTFFWLGCAQDEAVRVLTK
jgi:hypothetical protein